jgi:protein-tyrosine phosphatase
MSADCIVPRVWLGNKHAAADPDFLRENNIRVVFNCTKTLPFHETVLRKYRIPVDDNLEPSEIANLERWAPESIYKLVAEYNRGESILVHCHAGMQRSAAVMAMFLIAITQKPADEVMAYIRSKRSIAFFPQANFDAAIRGFERALR